MKLPPTPSASALGLIDQLAEQQIREAIGRGELENLPGAGRPLKLEDLSMVPEALRAGYLLLKNSGFLPPELETLRELRDVEALIDRIEDPALRAQELKRLRLLELRLREAGHDLSRAVEAEYRDKLQARLGGG
ncbi:protein of unknown function (DUF1992) [Thioflavicoccus mobilis 8321]|uniref:DnaJ homologue subfamily C member 28 conserved domain-containing protein n=1 Tax=Thioflavicoccus mobilis 8321 TaxID=765912 RepID=L0GZ14_9GAMM|nr:DnaJ family domain-containing protein [Thioflavicoccus mobilis]AGA91077.1 protein of unknown function (DUF1992) [Thioflavicoccus mobilis 8321]